MPSTTEFLLDTSVLNHIDIVHFILYTCLGKRVCSSRLPQFALVAPMHAIASDARKKNAPVIA